jgi:hypothetical protein
MASRKIRHHEPAEARPATLGGRSRPCTDETSHENQFAAESGIMELRKSVDTLIVIPNQTLFRVANEKTTLGAFSCLLLGCSTAWFRPKRWCSAVTC